MRKYYIIPVTSRSVSVNGKKLFDILKEADEELYERENERVNITYEENNPNKEEIKEYNMVTQQLYVSRSIPEKLAVLSDDDKYFELATEAKVECETSTYIDAFSVTSSDILDLFQKDENYYPNMEYFLSFSRKKTNEGQLKK